jgi:hypothetical protein
VQKTYVAKVRGRVTPAVIQRLRDGVELKDGPIHVDAAKILPGGTSKSHSLVEVTLHSGRNRIVRRMLAEVGHPVEELVRRQFGPLHLGAQRVGELRELSAAERGALLSAAAAGGTEAAPAASKPSGGKGDADGKGAGKSEDGNNATGGKKQRARDRTPQITAGRPGDGKGAKGMRGVAARGNPHTR